MQFKTIDLTKMGMLEAQAEMLLIKHEHKKNGGKEVLSFLLPKDKRSNNNSVFILDDFFHGSQGRRITPRRLDE